MKAAICLVLLAALMAAAGCSQRHTSDPTVQAIPVMAYDAHTPIEPTELAVLWTSGDPEVAHRVALMYTHASKTAGWYEDVRLIVWGPSSRLLAADKDLQAKVKAMMKDGIVVQACIVCAESYGVVEQLRSLGIEVLAYGKPLTKLSKDPAVKLMTF